MGGSPMMLKYTAFRSGLAFANMIWWPSVVLPPPGPPAIRLNENSGIPPPNTSSRPGTPDGSLRIGTRSLIFLVPLGCRLVDRRPGPSQHLDGQPVSDEGRQQVKEGSEQRRGSLDGDGGHERLQMRAQLRRVLGRGHIGGRPVLRLRQLRATREQRLHAGTTEQRREMSVELVV